MYWGDRSNKVIIIIIIIIIILIIIMMMMMMMIIVYSTFLLHKLNYKGVINYIQITYKYF